MMATVGVEHGLSLADCLAGSLITEAELNDRDVVIDASQELAVARAIVGKLGDPPGLGLEVGARVTLTNFGVLGFALLSSPTVRAAIEVGLRYLALSYAFVSGSLVERGERAWVVADDASTPPDVKDFLLERDLSAVMVLLPMFLGPVLHQYADDIRLELTLSEPRRRLIAELTPLPVVTSERHSALVFPRALLDEPIPQADEYTARMCEQQCRQLLQHRSERRGIADQVRSLLLRDPSSMPSAAQAAAALNLGPRTMARRLAAESTTYRALTEEVHALLARSLLEDVGLSAQQVARRLGYAEPSSFTRAFTRWYGAPPSRFRPPATRDGADRG